MCPVQGVTDVTVHSLERSMLKTQSLSPHPLGFAPPQAQRRDEYVSIVAMEKNLLLVLTRENENDPEISMLDSLPHVTGSEPSVFAEAAKDATVILNWSGRRELFQAVLAMAPNMRWVHSRATGVDRDLFPEFVESDITLTNGRGVFSPALGEFALAAILYFAKDFRRMIRNQAAGVWQRFQVEEIAGKTAGIVGYGDIGRAVASRAHPMGMRVLATKRHIPSGPDPLIERFYETGAQREMIARCDYIVVTAPLTSETRHLIGEAEFAAMKPTAVVINVGRGPVIDQAAMVRALSEKRIKGAALDVFEHEPLPPGDPMYKLENVLLSPHIADCTATWLEQAMRFFLTQYEHFQKGEPLKNVVNKKLGY
jgi:phosphoglycerate dehydrogenase-like enzyme